MSVMGGDEALLGELSALMEEHRRLNEEVDQLSADAMTPSLELQRLKKRKLALRDQIMVLRDSITPDIIA